MNQDTTLKMLLFVIIILTVPVTEATDYNLENKTIKIEEEQVRFTPLFESATCNETITNVFRIERESYETGIEPLSFSYMLEVRANEGVIGRSNITKTINKYSSANTGELKFNTSDKVVISVLKDNVTLNWTMESPCKNMTNTTSDQEQTSNQTEIGQEENNQTTTENTSETEDENETREETEKDESNNETVQTAIVTDKMIYNQGEQASIEFIVRPKQENTTISYWIEDLQGNTVKRKYTTTRLDKKHHTFSSIDQSDKAFVAFANISTGKVNRLERTYMIVKGDDKAETQEKQTEKQASSYINISVKDIIHDNRLETMEFQIELEAWKGTTRSQVILIEARDDKNKKLGSTIKLKLEEQQSGLEALIPLYVHLDKEVENVIVKAEGLDSEAKNIIPVIITDERDTTSEGKSEKKEKKEKNKPEVSIEKTYTRQSLLDTSLNWYVRVKSEGETIIEATHKNETVSTTQNITEEQTIQLTFNKPQPNMTIHTRVECEGAEDKRSDKIELEPQEHRNEQTMTSITGRSIREQVNVTSLISPEKEVNRTENITDESENKIRKVKTASAMAILVIGGIITGWKYYTSRRQTQDNEKKNKIHNKE